MLVLADSKGRVKVPIRSNGSLLECFWIDNKLYLTPGLYRKLTTDEYLKVWEFQKKHRVKGMPYTIHCPLEKPGKKVRITIPKAVRVSDLWKFYETTLEIASMKFQAYCLEPCKAVPLEKVVR